MGNIGLEIRVVVFYPAGRIECRKGDVTRGGKERKKAFSPLARGTNEACVPRSAMTLDAANELSRTDTILLPTCALQTRPPSPPTHPTFPTPSLRASSIIFVRARQPLSLFLSLALSPSSSVMVGGRRGEWRWGKRAFPFTVLDKKVEKARGVYAACRKLKINEATTRCY